MLISQSVRQPSSVYSGSERPMTDGTRVLAALTVIRSSRYGGGAVIAAAAARLYNSLTRPSKSYHQALRNNYQLALLETYESVVAGLQRNRSAP